MEKLWQDKKAFEIYMEWNIGEIIFLYFKLMLATIETGGKQYNVKEGDRINIEKIEGEEDSQVFFDKVLLIDDEKEAKVGAPYLEGAKVEGKIAAQFRGEKITIIKYKAKKRYRKKQGHRQNLTEVEIVKIFS